MPLTILNVSYPLATVTDDAAGGAEQVLAMLDQAIVRNGHRSLVIAPNGSKCQGRLIATEKVSGVLDDSAKRLARLLHREAIRKTLLNFDVDLVHLHGIDFPEYFPDADLPKVVTLHLPCEWYAADALQSRPRTYYICVSNSQKRTCAANASIHRVVENGVRFPEPLSKRNKLARPFVLGMGRICPEKGLHLAMDAARECGIRFLLAGTVYEYPEHRWYFEKEIRPRLQQGHRFLGSVGSKRKNQLLSDALCLLVPSLAPETSSLVAMEAMSHGTPVVAFRAGALCEIVDDGRTGFLVDSVEQMSEAIANIQQINPAECRRQAERRFSVTRMTDEYLALYRQIAVLRQPAPSELES
jgi:glycosyltransferase involved in cell wall biosynthesis